MPRAFRFFILLCLVFSALPVCVYAAQLTGRVVQVYSADLIEVQVDQTPVRVRLYGIKCPEGKQNFSSEAKKYTTDLSYGKIVTVHIINEDRRGGKIGTVMLPGEKSLNCELLKAGLAWWNQQSAPDDRILEVLEKSAKKNMVGLWADQEPVPPGVSRSTEAGPATDALGKTAGPPSIDDETTVYVTSTGEKYHRNGCRYLMTSMIPIRLGNARTSGLVPCPVCDPPK